MVNQDTATLSHRVERDLRLDLFRGAGLWMIFLDHIPDDFVAWLTLKNYGFSDAAEFFVFISGYLAGFIYEALGELSLAAPGYRLANELHPGVPLLEDALAGLEARFHKRIARDHLLPDDPQSTRPDSFYSITSLSLVVTRRF